jgi:RND family efflux transporter MFP subunit
LLVYTSYTYETTVLANRLAVLITVACSAFTVFAAGPPVTVQVLSEQIITRLVRVNGTVTSPRSATISASVAGLITELELDAGDRVEQGSVLVQLDPELAQLEAAAASASVNSSETQLADARRRLREAEKLWRDKGIAESEVKTLRAEVATDESDLLVASSQLRLREAIVARHTVRAPFGGVVNRRITEIGEWVNRGDGLVELVATDDLRFDFPVPQEFYAALKDNTRVELMLDAIPGVVLQGKVITAVPVQNADTRTFMLRVETATETDLPITPGMSARATLHLGTGRKAVVIPRDALLRKPDGGTSVWVLDESGSELLVHERSVKTGIDMGQNVEARSGVTAGEKVVTRGNEALRDGQTVRLK